MDESTGTAAYNMLDAGRFKSLPTTLLGETLKHLSHRHLFECCSYLCLRNNVPPDNEKWANNVGIDDRRLDNFVDNDFMRIQEKNRKK